MNASDFEPISTREFPLGPDGRPDANAFVPHKMPDWAWALFGSHEDAPELDDDDYAGFASWLWGNSPAVRYLFPADDDCWGTSVNQDGKLALFTEVSPRDTEDLDWIAESICAKAYVGDGVEFVLMSSKEIDAKARAEEEAESEAMYRAYLARVRAFS